jgi:cytosine/adenosine deaminase-related metal-dependent hydrolase
VEFLQSGQGPFRTFLEERGVWDGSFTPPATGPVHYLEGLDLLDHQTLCVHAVHLGDDEIQLLAEKKAKVCLCPGSNRFLGVGRAQPEKMLAAGIRPCLGTDSLASNPQLSLWREMAILAQDHPALPAETIVAMATRYGAEALGQSRQGHLQKGSCRPFLAVAYGGNDPFDFLVRDVAPKELSWL